MNREASESALTVPRNDAFYIFSLKTNERRVNGRKAVVLKGSWIQRLLSKADGYRDRYCGGKKTVIL